MRTGTAHDIPSGGACALQLPFGPQSAKAARSFVVGTLNALKLPTDHIGAAELSISELATNSHLHAAKPAVPPEVWIWARTSPVPELTFSVFDASRACLPTPYMQRQDLLDEHGNGLGIVKALASDTNSHFTRSRLAPKPVAGKAVWFTQAIPASLTSYERSVPEPIAASRLLIALRSRGIDVDRRRDDSGLTVVAAVGFPIWVDAKSYFWREGDGCTHRPLIDLHETTEAIISRIDASPEYR